MEKQVFTAEMKGAGEMPVEIAIACLTTDAVATLRAEGKPMTQNEFRMKARFDILLPENSAETFTKNIYTVRATLKTT
jgi:hypothetical protein